MKQKFLSILSLVMITAVTANAQVATNYRGAFEPAPAAQWTDNWTNWDPQNTYYRPATDSVTGVITTNTTWTKDKVYKLKGIVYVDSLATLTIEAGTLVIGNTPGVGGISALVVQRGAKIIANGTACNPIVFTSSAPIGSRQKGDWGGITLLGRAVNNKGLEEAVEGILDDGSRRIRHGGTVDNDTSGSLRYVRIEYAGFTQSTDKELNSLTMASVGSGTTIDHIQTSFGNDDAFEWFGGTVNCSYLVAYRCLDDDLDVDMGYSGIVQFALSIKDADLADKSVSEGFESDNGGGSTTASFTTTPRTTAKFYNVTQIGGFRCTSNSNTTIIRPTTNFHGRGARLRRGSKIEVYNSILLGNYVGLEMTNEGGGSPVDAVFQNNIIANDTTLTYTNVGFDTGYYKISPKALFVRGSATISYINNAANRNTLVGTPCAILTNAWDFLNPDYRPNASGTTGGLLSGADLNPSGSIESALFSPNQEVEYAVDLFEIGAGNSNGTITVTIPASSAFDILVPGLTVNATPTAGTDGNFPNLGVDYTNSNWNFSFDGTNFVITSKSGYSISKGGSATLGFKVRRKSGIPAGFQTISIGVSGGSDKNAANNDALTGVTAL